MITLTIFSIFIICIILSVVVFAGGLLATLLDIAVAVGIIYLIVKLITKIARKNSKESIHVKYSTPNGVYEVKGYICRTISFSENHLAVNSREYIPLPF